MIDTTGVSRHPHPSAAARFRLIAAWLGLLGLLTATGLAQAQQPGERKAPAPGEYTWNPERSTAGPVVIIVTLDDQLAYVYRAGTLIGVSTVSTGRRGYPTPTGVFQILQKKIEHYSNLYDDAPMPFMQRLTWGGLALHAGRLPGYPASHGCIRLPLEFAKRLFDVTTMTTTVVITERHVDPSETRARDLILPTAPLPLPGGGTSSVGAPVDVIWHPEEAPRGPIGIVVSSADEAIYVYRDGVLIGRAGLRLPTPRRRLAPAAFVLLDAAPAEAAPGLRRWMAVPLSNDSADPLALEGTALPDRLVASVSGLLEPGTVLIVTNDAVTADTMSDGDFTVIATDDVASPGARPE